MLFLPVLNENNYTIGVVLVLVGGIIAY